MEEQNYLGRYRLKKCHLFTTTHPFVVVVVIIIVIIKVVIIIVVLIVSAHLVEKTVIFYK